MLACVNSYIATLPNFCALQSVYCAAHCTEIALVKIVDNVLQSLNLCCIDSRPRYRHRFPHSELCDTTGEASVRVQYH